MSNPAIAAIHREREALQAQIRSLQDQLAGLDRALAILEHRSDTAAAPPRPTRPATRGVGQPAASRRRRGSGGPRPRNQALVLEFLAEAGAAGVTVNEVLDRGSARGVPLARASISSLLSRLKRQGRVTGDGGRYVLLDEPSG